MKLIFIFLAFNLIIITYEKENEKFCSTEMSSFGWPMTLQEEIKITSTHSDCPNTNTLCRKWDEVRNIAFCKAAKLSGLLPINYNLYYVVTYYKTLNYYENAKFIYGFMDLQTNKITYLKLCIPINKEKISWFDDRCPLDDCIELNNYDGKCGREKADNIEFELKQNIQNNIGRMHIH